MDRKQNIQAALKKAFCLSPRLTVAIAIPSFVFVFVMLGVDATPPHTPLFYLACLLSSYALVITISDISQYKYHAPKELNRLLFCGCSFFESYGFFVVRAVRTRAKEK